MLVKLGLGWDRLSAGSFAFTSTAFPMLTGTLVTAAGFLPVGFARSGTGEYTTSMFWVVVLALLLSWVVAVSFVPYLGSRLMRTAITPHDDPAFHRVFRRIVTWCVLRRWIVIATTVLAFGLAAFGFTRVPRQFFPSSARLEVVIDMRLPGGSSFAATADAVARLSAILDRQPGIRNYIAYTGQGSPRFFLASNLEL
jgi:multidrug efflux pump subunit AcrB